MVMAIEKKKETNFITVAMRKDVYSRIRELAGEKSISDFLNQDALPALENLPKLEDLVKKFERLSNRVHDHQNKLEAIEELMPMKYSNQFDSIMTRKEIADRYYQEHKAEIDAKYNKILSDNNDNDFLHLIVDHESGKPVKWLNPLHDSAKVDEVGRERARKARADRMKKYEEGIKKNKGRLK